MKLHLLLIVCFSVFCSPCQTAKQNEKAQLCIDGYCKKKCCADNEIWDSSAKICQLNPSSSPIFRWFKKRSVDKKNSCPNGEILQSFVHQTAEAFSRAICIEDVLFIDKSNVHQMKRLAFTCNDFSNTPHSFKVSPIDSVKHSSSAAKIHLTECCKWDGDNVNQYKCAERLSQNWSVPIHHKQRKEITKWNADKFHISKEVIQCQKGFIYHRTSEFILYENGTMSVPQLDQEYKPGQFCLEHIREKETQNDCYFEATFCIPDPCSEKTCIRKCCAQEHAFTEHHGKYSCVSHNATLVLEFKNNMNETIPISQENYVILPEAIPHCLPVVINPPNFYFLPSGSLYLPNADEQHRIETKYCVDFSTEEKTLIALVCPSEQPETPEDLKKRLTYFPYLLFLSSFFLLATLFVYCIIPEIRNIHGVIIMFYAGSFAVAFICLGIIQLSPAVDDISCIILAIVLHYSLLTSFSWVNVLSFDIWLVFRNIPSRTTGNGMKSIAGSCRFKYYLLYALVLPLLIVGTGQLIQWIPNLHDVSIKPDFGEKKCWFNDPHSALVYYYVPCAVQSCINLVFFMLSSRNIYKTTLDVSLARRKQSRKWLRIVASFFILMGVVWILDIISWVVGGNAYYWTPIDLFNVLNGPMMFATFVCKKNILQLLEKKLSLLCGSVPSTAASTSTNISQTLAIDMKSLENEHFEAIYFNNTDAVTLTKYYVNYRNSLLK